MTFVRLTTLGALAALCGLTACATSSEPVAVDVKNDLPESVTLKVCKSHDCSRTGDDWLLKPGQLGGGNVEVKSGYNSMIVLGSSSQQIGCLPFRLSRRPSERITVKVSQAVACGSRGGADAAGGKDWPDPRL